MQAEVGSLGGFSDFCEAPVLARELSERRGAFYRLAAAGEKRAWKVDGRASRLEAARATCRA